MKFVKKYGLFLLFVVVIILCVTSTGYHLSRDSAIDVFLKGNNTTEIERVVSDYGNRPQVVIRTDNEIYNLELRSLFGILWKIGNTSTTYIDDSGQVGNGDVFISPLTANGITHIFGFINNTNVSTVQVLENGILISKCSIEDGQRLFTLGHLDRWVKGFEFIGLSKSGEVIWEYTY